MSVTTEADKKLDEIRKEVKEVYHKLLAFYNTDDMWGRDEYTQKFEDDMEKALDHLRSAKKLLR